MSPLLANIYMRRFLKAWKQRGNDFRFGSRIVNYADDFVILCRRDATGALSEAQRVLTRIGLTINEAKTRIRHAPRESFDFLGYTIGRCYSTQTGRAYIGTRPSKEKVQRLCRAISEETSARLTLLEPEQIVTRLNRLMTGWANYFCLGPVSKAYAAAERHAVRRPEIANRT